MGEIHDETDDATFSIRKLKNKNYRCNSDVELKHLEQYLEKQLKLKEEHFPWGDNEDHKTLNYFLLEVLERFPEEGEEVTIESEHRRFEFTIRKVQDNMIRLVDFGVEKI